MATQNVTTITPPRVPLTDSRTGLISREWYRFFLNLFVLTGSGQNTTSLTDLQVGPPALTVDEVNQSIAKLSENVAPSQDVLLAQIAELQKRVDALAVQSQPQIGTLGELQQSNLPWVTFDNTPQFTPTATPGTIYWDEADGNQTLSLVMAGGTVTQQIGQEQYYRIKADSTITEGQVIAFTGTVGSSGALKGAPATGLTAATALYVMGVATENISTNGWGYVTSFGLVRGIDTSGGAESWVDGQILYLNPFVAGGLTKTVPTAPNPKVVVAAVVKASASNGSLFVRPAFGGKLGDFEGDVQITSPAANDLLQWNGTRWQNVAPASVIAGSGGAPVTKTADFTVASGENWIIVNKSSSCTVTLPTPSSNTGRSITIKTIQPQTVVSSSSNVIPISGSTAGTTILEAFDGNWSTLVSDGSNWVTMASRYNIV